MSNEAYLIHEISKIISPPKRNYYWMHYNKILGKRFLALSLLLFIFEYLTTFQLGFAKSPLPLYPPIGITFIGFYLFGNRALTGLLLGGFAAYFLRNLPLKTVTLYLMADIAGGYVGAYLCQSVLSSDIKPFANLQEFFKFFGLNALLICPFSSLARTLPLASMMQIIEIQNLFFYYINLWLADLNAILIFPAFLLSWIVVPFSKETISRHSLKLLFISLTIFVLCSLWFVRTFEFIYMIIPAMFISLALARFYGYLVAMLLLFVITTLYLVYFMILQQYYLQEFGIVFYTFIPITLLVYIVSMIYISTSRKRTSRLS